MDQRILQDIPIDERVKYIRENAYKVDPKYTYTRELEEGELQEMQNVLSQNLIEIDAAEQVLKSAKEIYNATVKPIKEHIKGSLQCIRTRSEEVTGEVFLIKDEHEQRMGIYSKEGVLLFERSLLPEEKQYSIVDNTFKKAN
ncbi:hypothetical protein [Flavobacterium sp. NRK1]|uniref:hypothetical protein n=1 Tax=Flavobacterium sp. NRK1 TaxID=2954929 RepID=UPI0020930C5C|nr:hypothetical protein [Flavobacterium sp. NRK1]MCO6149086.1 hypothetical protein [Flavobacterium sp. NRK1]